MKLSSSSVVAVLLSARALAADVFYWPANDPFDGVTNYTVHISPTPIVRSAPNGVIKVQTGTSTNATVTLSPLLRTYLCVTAWARGKQSTGSNVYTNEPAAIPDIGPSAPGELRKGPPPAPPLPSPFRAQESEADVSRPVRAIDSLGVPTIILRPGENLLNVRVENP